MTTLKSYTDLEQSKKLAEILPLESADMRYDGVMLELKIPKVRYNGLGTPCWSFAALLNILPSATLDSSDDHHYRVHCNERFTDWHDNSVDACVAMIEKLHKLNLL